jgi:ubiquitin carboxyl-terminal hydrolase 4/11/15
MNSGLQCLSHIDLLTEYFLSGKYVQDINKTNPLGTKGELSTEYAKMIKKLWLGDEMNFAPTHLKKSIGKFQPMFTGYNQHDSGELITYLLDGLHEDLNRVI